MHASNPERDGFAAGLLAGDGSGERSRLLGTLEAGLARRAPRDGVPVRVGDRDGRVVESRGDVGDSFRLDHPFCLFTNCHDYLVTCITWYINPRIIIQYRRYLVTFFLPAIARRGPFLVRALVCVR